MSFLEDASAPIVSFDFSISYCKRGLIIYGVSRLQFQVLNEQFKLCEVSSLVEAGLTPVISCGSLKGLQNA